MLTSSSRENTNLTPFWSVHLQHHSGPHLDGNLTYRSRGPCCFGSTLLDILLGTLLRLVWSVLLLGPQIDAVAAVLAASAGSIIVAAVRLQPEVCCAIGAGH